MLALLLLALAQDDTLDDGALLRREVRQVRHVVHGGRAAGGARTRRELRSCAARPRHSASLAPEVYLIMPGGQWRDCKLTSARLLIAPASGSTPATARAAAPPSCALPRAMRAHGSLADPCRSIYISSCNVNETSFHESIEAIIIYAYDSIMCNIQ